jgi:hypothetical protein
LTKVRRRQQFGGFYCFSNNTAILLFLPIVYSLSQYLRLHATSLSAEPTSGARENESGTAASLLFVATNDVSVTFESLNPAAARR